jgi:hypothetical protein
VDVLKLAFPAAASDSDPPPDPTPMATALLRVCNAVYRGTAVTADTPAWHCALLVPVPKPGGDRTQPNDHRGIGLQAAVAKLVPDIMRARLQSIDDADPLSPLLNRGQAGFRTGEEAIGQVDSLMESCQRAAVLHSGEKRPVFVLFVDLRKAYDRVPHEILLAKLEAMGVAGAALDFVRRRLDEGTALVKVGGRTAQTPFPVRIGVTQGDPFSPLAFDVFVEDAPGSRVDVGCTDVSTHSFADDMAMLAESLEDLSEAFERLKVWCHDNNMELSASKCGAMVVNGSETDRAALEDADLQTQDGERIPVVREYRYLGVWFNDELDLSRMVAARVQAANLALHALMPLLRDHRVPIEQRFRSIKAFLLPVVQYGAELWGMSARRVAPLRRVVDSALRACLRAPKSVPLATLYAEARIVPYHVFAAAARARALFKWRASKTHVHRLVRARVWRARGSARDQTWSEAGRRWLRRQQLPTPPTDDDEEVEDKSGQVTRKLVIERGLETDPLRAGRSWERYEHYKLEQTAKELHFLQRLGWAGAHWSVDTVVAMRTGAFVTAKMLARWGVQAPRFLELCPFCGAAVGGESIVHFLVSCDRWERERIRFLVPVWRAAGVLRWRSNDARHPDLAYLLLGGRVGSRCGPSAARGVQIPLGASCTNWLVSASRFMRVVGPLRLRELRPTAVVSQSRHHGGRTGSVEPNGQRGSA